MFELQPIQQDIQLLGFHSIDYFEFGKNFSHTPEKHNFWEMVYSDKGSIISVANGVGYTMHQGQAVFHEPGEIHAHLSDQKVPNNMLVVTFSAEGEAMRFFSRKCFTLDKTSKILLSLFIQEYKSAVGNTPDSYHEHKELDLSHGLFGCTQMLQCYLTEFLIRLIRDGYTSGKHIRASEESRLIAANSLVTQIVSFMQENLYKDLSLQNLCDHFLIGKSQLSKLFRDCTGVSPMRYYGGLKITEIKKLLREETYSIGEISDMLCFSNIHCFSRTFKRETGFSPTAYQKSILSALEKDQADGIEK